VYHRLARTDRYRWWKPAVELVVFGLLVLVLWFGVMPIVFQIVGPGDDGAPGIIKLGLAIACATPAAFLAARIVRGRGGAGALLSVDHRLRGRWLAVCAAVAFAQVAISIAISRAILGGPARAWPGWEAFWPLALSVVLVIPLQAAAEEFGFRAILLQSFGAWVRRPWFAIAISSVVFALAHGLPPAGFIAIGTFGLVAAWLTVYTRGLEAALALHVINNVLLFLLAAANGRGDRWVTELNENVRWTATAIDVTLDVLYGVVIAKLYSRRRLALGDRAVEPLPRLGG
jgi:uncharacterized protein